MTEPATADQQSPRRHAVDFCRRRTHEDIWLPLAITSLIASLSLGAATVPDFQHVLAVAALALAGGAAALWALLRIRRTIRWRREDREDAAYAAAWRAAHREHKSQAGARR